jgi:hypothetical protein
MPHVEEEGEVASYQCIPPRRPRKAPRAERWALHARDGRGSTVARIQGDRAGKRRAVGGDEGVGEGEADADAEVEVELEVDAEADAEAEAVADADADRHTPSRLPLPPATVSTIPACPLSAVTPCGWA